MKRIRTGLFVRLVCAICLGCSTGSANAAPHETILQLDQRVEALAAQQTLTPGQGTSLGVKLDHAARQLELGEPQSAIRQLRAFELESTALGAVLPQKDAQFLIGQSQLARREISDLAFELPAHRAGTIQPCFSDIGCEYTVLHVDAAATGLADGTADNPFSSIAEALVDALKRKACGVELRLAAGTFAESVTVPLHLKLRGEGRGVVIGGSVVNHDGWALAIERLQIRSAPAPGAIVTDSLCPSDTEISRVDISGAAGFGVFQRGGRLRMNLSSVADTRAHAGLPGSGTGIMLTDGVQAIIGLVDVERSRSSGLAAAGPATRVYVAASRFANGAVALPATAQDVSRPPAAGVDVREGALALVQFTTLTGNELYGLAVTDGGQLHFRYGSVENTRELPRSHPLGDFVAANLFGSAAAAIELTSFTIQNGLVGLFLDASPATATIGQLRNHEVGIFLDPDPPEPEEFNKAFHCVTNRVSLINNRRNVAGLFLPVPGDGNGDPPVCVGVPFACTWCDL